jgi:hypothetical protein
MNSEFASLCNEAFVALYEAVSRNLCAEVWGKSQCQSGPDLNWGHPNTKRNATHSVLFKWVNFKEPGELCYTLKA